MSLPHRDVYIAHINMYVHYDAHDAWFFYRCKCMFVLFLQQCPHSSEHALPVSWLTHLLIFQCKAFSTFRLDSGLGFPPTASHISCSLLELLLLRRFSAQISILLSADIYVSECQLVFLLDSISTRPHTVSLLYDDSVTGIHSTKPFRFPGTKLLSRTAMHGADVTIDFSFVSGLWWGAPGRYRLVANTPLHICELLGSRSLAAEAMDPAMHFAFFTNCYAGAYSKRSPVPLATFKPILPLSAEPANSRPQKPPVISANVTFSGEAKPYGECLPAHLSVHWKGPLQVIHSYSSLLFLFKKFLI